MWPNRVCWPRLVVVNCIVIMMASLRLSSPSVSTGVSSALEVYHDLSDHFLQTSLPVVSYFFLHIVSGPCSKFYPILGVYWSFGVPLSS